MAKSKAEQHRQDVELAPVWPDPPVESVGMTARTISGKDYRTELAKLQIELVKCQEWVRAQRAQGRHPVRGPRRRRQGRGDQDVHRCRSTRASPGSPRCPAPSERERSQWYFQRYVAHLPSAGEMVLFDRSWYNRAGVERVMGFCTDAEYQEFMRSCPEFERMLVRSGIMVVKYWFSVSDEEQERRFQARLDDPTKRWKLSPMDLQSRARWVEYSRAKDEMFAHTDIKQAPWYVVDADDKKRARLNVIHHFLSLIPYEDLTPEQIVLPPRQPDQGYIRPPRTEQTYVPEVY